MLACLLCLLALRWLPKMMECEEERGKRQVLALDDRVRRVRRCRGRGEGWLGGRGHAGEAAAKAAQAGKAGKAARIERSWQPAQRRLMKAGGGAFVGGHSGCTAKKLDTLAGRPSLSPPTRLSRNLAAAALMWCRAAQIQTRKKKERSNRVVIRASACA